MTINPCSLSLMSTKSFRTMATICSGVTLRNALVKWILSLLPREPQEMGKRKVCFSNSPMASPATTGTDKVKPMKTGSFWRMVTSRNFIWTLILMFLSWLDGALIPPEWLNLAMLELGIGCPGIVLFLVVMVSDLLLSQPNKNHQLWLN
jgi:hypothetical protein